MTEIDIMEEQPKDKLKQAINNIEMNHQISQSSFWSTMFGQTLN
jgi:hypothetical protein